MTAHIAGKKDNRANERDNKDYRISEHMLCAI